MLTCVPGHRWFGGGATQIDDRVSPPQAPARTSQDRRQRRVTIYNKSKNRARSDAGDSRAGGAWGTGHGGGARPHASNTVTIERSLNQHPVELHRIARVGSPDRSRLPCAVKPPPSDLERAACVIAAARVSWRWGFAVPRLNLRGMRQTSGGLSGYAGFVNTPPPDFSRPYGPLPCWPRGRPPRRGRIVAASANPINLTAPQALRGSRRRSA